MSAEKKKKNRKNYYYVAIALVLILSLIFIKLRKNPSENEGLITATVEKGELIATVGGTGKVEANKSAILTWQTSGNVSKVHVKNGDSVHSGDLLAELSRDSLPQNVILAQADLVDAKRNLENVLKSNTTRYQTYLDLLKAEEDLKDAKDDRDRWNYNNADDKTIDKARTAFIQAEEALKQARAELAALPENASKSELQKAQDSFNQAQLSRDKALRNLNYILGKAYDTEVAEDFANYDLAQAKLEDAQREWDRVKDGQNEDDILAAQARVDAAKALVEMANLRAPFDGTITSVMTKEGDEIVAGASAFSISDLSKFFIEVDIPEIDINRVQIGQAAEFTFDSMLDKTYHGKVVEVSEIGIEKEGETNFTIKLLMSDSDENVLPGMTASVSITVLKLEDVLIVPTRALRLEDGETVVYVQRNGSIVRIPVQIGSSSDNNTQILSGDLSEGDILVLNPPQDFLNMMQQPPSFTR